jgi:hypothetical protein
MDYIKGGARVLVLSALYLVGFVVFAMGTIVVFTVTIPGA